MSEKEGLVFACVLDGKGGGEPIDREGIKQWQARKVYFGFTLVMPVKKLADGYIRRAASIRYYPSK
jgi:hypothetical protein